MVENGEELIDRIMRVAEAFELGRLTLPWPRVFRLESDDLEVRAMPIPGMDPTAPYRVRIQLGVGNLVVVGITWPSKEVNWRHGGLAPQGLDILRKHQVLDDLAGV